MTSAGPDIEQADSFAGDNVIVACIVIVALAGIAHFAEALLLMGMMTGRRGNGMTNSNNSINRLEFYQNEIVGILFSFCCIGII